MAGLAATGSAALAAAAGSERPGSLRRPNFLHARHQRQLGPEYPNELKLPLAPYRFEWRGEPAVEGAKDATTATAEERYTHADGTTTIIREYQADSSSHIMSDRVDIEPSTTRATLMRPGRLAVSGCPD